MSILPFEKESYCERRRGYCKKCKKITEFYIEWTLQEDEIDEKTSLCICEECKTKIDLNKFLGLIN